MAENMQTPKRFQFYLSSNFRKQIGIYFNYSHKRIDCYIDIVRLHIGFSYSWYKILVEKE